VAICVNVDWGEEYIPAMLEEFKKAQAQVTFFVTGSWAEKNPELLKQMSEAGHSIQNHAYKHVHFSSLSDAEAQAQIKKAEAVIEKIIGKKTRFFAPPYGEQNDRLVKAAGEIGYELIMWSVDTIDWQKPSPQTIVKRVGNKVHNDAIILMHPTDPTLQALPDLLAYLQDQGYGMITIDSILVKTDVTS
jgi:probable sporulation protein (polysaccharide deacetylase family)